MQTVIIVFWGDNLDPKVELETGSSAVNITTIMAFQEESIGAVPDKRIVSLPKTKAGENDLDSVFDISKKYCIWIYLRYTNRS